METAGARHQNFRPAQALMASPTTESSIMPRRLIALEGGCNFRDIGGYCTPDGRTVRWGQVYRAGVLSYFTDADRDTLIGLGVRAICDLRRAEEREREPTAWPEDSTHALSWDDGTDAPTIRACFARHPYTAAGMRSAMIDLYRALPIWMAPRMRGFLECLTSGKTPLVIHCAAGKDRTGIAVALLLGMLGIPREVIIEDYLLTNHTTDYEQFVLSRQALRLGLPPTQHPLLELPADIRQVLFGADPAYLDAGLEQIEREFGGMDAYVGSTVGVNREARERIKNALLV